MHISVGIHWKMQLHRSTADRREESFKCIFVEIISSTRGYRLTIGFVFFSLLLFHRSLRKRGWCAMAFGSPQTFDASFDSHLNIIDLFVWMTWTVVNHNRPIWVWNLIIYRSRWFFFDEIGKKSRQGKLTRRARHSIDACPLFMYSLAALCAHFSIKFENKNSEIAFFLDHFIRKQNYLFLIYSLFGDY